MKNRLEQLISLLSEFNVGMLTTQSSHGRLSTRPMSLQDPRSDQALWMVSTKDTSSSQNIKSHAQVNLSFHRSSDQAWISIAATAKVNENRQTIEKLWQDDWEMWLDESKDKAKVVLLELEPFQIDFWEPEHGKIGQLFELAKAQITDSRPSLAPVRTVHVSDVLLAKEMNK